MTKFSQKRITTLSIGLLLLVLVFLSMEFGLFLLSPADKSSKDQVIIIEEGLSLNGTAEKLKQNHIITNKFLFMTWVRVFGYSREIKAGEFRLSARMSPIRVMEILTRGVIITHPVTIPEGYNRGQIAELLGQKELVDKQMFLSLTEEPKLLASYRLSGTSLEGYLYPDTYQFAKGLSAGSIINTMVRRFFEMIEPYSATIKDSDLSLQELITLASIVEKETGRKEERPIIASVFLNRLKKGMRLASDPTVIYGIKDFNGNITRKNLEENTPYNTYLIRGLPPGPIACPGVAAIKAVLYPTETDYLYFVSKNDGSHHFSKTLSEHNRAVEIYQKRKKRRS